MSNKRRIIFRILGLVISTVPTVLSVLFYFPLWAEKDVGTLISGFSLLLILIALIPLWRVIKKILKTPSAYVIWLLIFIAFLLLSKICEEMIVISFTGFISNVIGAVFFKISKRGEGRDNE